MGLIGLQSLIWFRHDKICLTPSNDVTPLAANPFTRVAIHREWSKDGGQRNAEEDEAADDGEGVGPAEVVVQQVDQGRHEERADAGAGLGDALRKGALLLKVGRHHDDGRQVDQAETHTCAICFISNVKYKVFLEGGRSRQVCAYCLDTMKM